MTVILRAKIAALVLGLGISSMAQAEDPDTVTVYKSPTCGCCEDWVTHMEDNDFEVIVKDTQNLNPIKAEAGLTPALASCHTAFVDGYVIEGHVPASDVRRLLEQGVEARGLAVPGMPAGSPGMEMGDRQDDYQVLLFNDQGQTKVFATYPE
ncbi:DUF411 domain-containing protein [Marinobacter salicampi]|uniref:DUF411 domain-containing protein n=1 Tax=Marinobacter salicampi TaxID=435907 RepID=UPI00140A1753|nr:DUF411 domain-containing protein [Marinobacter salicampi]